MRLRLPLIVLGVLAGLFVLAWTQRHRFTPVDVGSPAPAFTATTLHGDAVSMPGAPGKVLVLNAWATWCPPCIREMPALERLNKRLPQLDIVAVSTDDFPEEIQQWVDKFGITFDILHDVRREMENRYLVNGLPTTFVIDRKGNIVYKIQGAREWDDPHYIALFEKLLAES